MLYLPLLTFLVSAWAATALFYRELPQLMPTQWAVSSKPDGFTAKPCVSWLDAIAVPTAVTFVLAGCYISTAPYTSVRQAFPSRFAASEADWAHTRGVGCAVLVVLGLGVLALVILRM